MSHSDDPRHRYKSERERLDSKIESGGVSETTGENIEEVLDALDPEERSPTFDHDGERVEIATNSLIGYCLRLRLFSTEAGGDLMGLSNRDVEGLIEEIEAGNAGIGPDDGYASSTMGAFASALIAFYRYHDTDVDPEEITVPAQSSTSIDERDLWEVHEIEKMRREIDSKRNEALFEILAYTGQRIRVIQTLRVRDIDLDRGDTGRYYVNEDADGRKNREGHGPLLGAEGPVRRWLQVHPTGEPDDALITCQPGWKGNTEPGSRLNQSTIRSALRGIANRAGVDKKVHPHMFRHYFTTVALKPKERGGFEMKPTYVKRLRGDAPGSTVMETTYSHLIDEDASSHAETQFTGKEPEEQGNALTPAAPCGVCGEMMQAGDAACTNCGAKRSPDAEKSEVEQLEDRIEELEAQQAIAEDVGAAKALTTGDLTEEELSELANDDALLAKMIELRANDS